LHHFEGPKKNELPLLFCPIFEFVLKVIQGYDRFLHPIPDIKAKGLIILKRISIRRRFNMYFLKNKEINK
jgi:hypothetical protein